MSYAKKDEVVQKMIIHQATSDKIRHQVEAKQISPRNRGRLGRGNQD
jgi:hypothetical protein